MPTISHDLVNRVRKLPKPSNAAQALNPLFEAVSNAFFAIDDLNEALPETLRNRGRIDIEVEQLSKPNSLKIAVTDNGFGLDDRRFHAFCVMDTDFKIAKGGKGVGRIYWLDCFQKVLVSSLFPNADGLRSREFEFVLANENQVALLQSAIIPLVERGTRVNFSGLRGELYGRHFPKRSDTFLRYFSAHFIADFLVGTGPLVFVNIDGEITEYPKAIVELVIGEAKDFETEVHPEFGRVSIKGFTCNEDASKGLEGTHQLHFLANNRTVLTREVDKLLGILRVSQDGHDDLVFHGCISSEFLNQHVNEGRTAFNFDESTLKELSRFCVDAVKTQMLPDQISEYEAARRSDYRDFVARYPIYGFADEDTQLGRVPFGARSPEEFAAGLVKHQIRGEEKRQREVQNIIGLLEGERHVPQKFFETVVEVANELKKSEQLALAQHVVKRKLVLEVLERLILRIRTRDEQPDDHHLEETLHSFICPMKVDGQDPNSLSPSSHDLWVVDERLAFTRAFSSDRRLDQTMRNNKSPLRPDLMLWDNAFGLGVIDPLRANDELDLSEPLKKVMVVEFKRPGRKSYAKVEDDLERQITKYLRQLKSGEIETYDRRKVRISNDCQFFCYVIADIVGDLEEEQLSTWTHTANGEGRFRHLDGAFKGSSIEVIQWSDLINDAWLRNSATMHAAGLRRGKSTVA